MTAFVLTSLLLRPARIDLTAPAPGGDIRVPFEYAGFYEDRPFVPVEHRATEISVTLETTTAEIIQLATRQALAWEEGTPERIRTAQLEAEAGRLRLLAVAPAVVTPGVVP